MTPGTLVSDGILRGTYLGRLRDQALVTLEAGATIWLPVHTLSASAYAASVVDDWDGPERIDHFNSACATEGCAREAQPGGYCRSCVRAERKREREAGIVPWCRCGNALYSRGLCKNCYERERKGGWKTR